jgi:hypothetical protein
MAVECGAVALADAAKCLSCLSPQIQGAIQIRLLCALINGETMTCSATTLVAEATSSMYANLPTPIQQAIITHLLCQLASGAAGSIGTTFGNYGGGPNEPTFTPASGTGVAVDTFDGTVWYYYSGSWH